MYAKRQAKILLDEAIRIQARSRDKRMSVEDEKRIQEIQYQLLVLEDFLSSDMERAA